MTTPTRIAPTGSVRLLEMLPSPATTVDLGAHLGRYGELPLRGYAGPNGPQPLADTVETADLRGRGGAGFQLSTKMRAVARRSRGGAVVVANGAESEPLSRKDALLLTYLPHLVLDGAVLAADAVGADQVRVVVQGGPPYRAVVRAVAERRDPVHVSVHASPAGYVASQETSLVQWLSGGPAKPTFTPPLPVESGIRGRATLVNNVETFAHLALIGRYGADWFRQLGTRRSPGTLLVTIDGAVERPGVLEVPFGTPIADLLDGAASDPGARALLVGGWFGGWLDGQVARTLTVDPPTLANHGLGVGAGVLFLLPTDWCGLAYVAEVADWLAAQSAGQCGPCVNGLPAIASALSTLHAGRTDGDIVARLRRWCGLMPGRGACRHPDGVARFVATALDVFAAEIGEHRRGLCRAKRATA